MARLGDLVGINIDSLPINRKPGLMEQPMSPEYLQYQKTPIEWDYSSGRVEDLELAGLTGYTNKLSPFRPGPDFKDRLLNSPELLSQLLSGGRRSADPGFIETVRRFPDQSYMVDGYEYDNPFSRRMKDLGEKLIEYQAGPNRMNLNAMSLRDGLRPIFQEEQDAAVIAARNAELEKQKLIERMAATTDGLAPGVMEKDGWRIDKITSPQRASHEGTAANATWCTKKEDVAKAYMRRGDLYLVRGSDGVARIQIYTNKGGELKEVRNRVQSRSIPDTGGKALAREFVQSMGARGDARELRRLGIEPNE